MSAPRVIVFGYDELALACVDVIRRLGGDVTGAVFPSNRAGDPRMDEVRTRIEAWGVPTLTQPPRRRIRVLTEQLMKLNPELFLVWSYPMILPPDLLDVPRLGAFNLHMGLLPEYRGANGIVWALINGERQTGVTLHVMDAGIDTGAMIGQARFPIAPEDDIVSLLKHAHAAGRTVLERHWPQLVSGSAVAMPQDESRAGYYAPRTDDDARIDWTQTSLQIHNLVRSLAFPFPGAVTRLDDQPVIIRRSKLISALEASTSPGEIIGAGTDGVRVQTGDGVLLLTEVEVAGERHSSGFEQLGMTVGKSFAAT